MSVIMLGKQLIKLDSELCLEIGKLLVQHNCYCINKENSSVSPFIWKHLNGVAPVACDCRRLNGSPPGATLIAHYMKLLVDSWIRQSKLKVDVVIGIESAGVPWATRLADSYRLPLGTIEADHREKVKINLPPEFVGAHKKAIIVDDSAVYGCTVANAIDALRMCVQIQTLAFFSITNWDTKLLKELLSAREIDISTLVDHRDVLEAAVFCGLVNEKERSGLDNFYRSLDAHFGGS